jgi:lysozyme family protein
MAAAIPNPIPPRAWSEYFDFLLHWEGTVFENDPADSGGATKYGIDAAAHPGIDIAAITARQASQLHCADYFKTAAESLPYPLNYAYFDFAMNAGERAAARCAQQVLGVADDGIFGRRSTAALRDFVARHGEGLFLVRFSNKRELHYRNLAATRTGLAKFLRGWLNRTAACKTWCGLRLAAEGVAQ